MANTIETWKDFNDSLWANYKASDALDLGKQLLAEARELRDSNQQGIARLVVKKYKEHLDRHVGQIEYIKEDGTEVITKSFAEWAQSPYFNKLHGFFINNEAKIAKDLNEGF